MRRFLVVGAVSAVTVAAVAAVARADVVEPYEANEVTEVRTLACGDTATGSTGPYHSFCAQRVDVDGDGIDDWAHVEWQLWWEDFTVEQGGSEVPLEAVAIDVEGGSAVMDIVADDCRVVADLVASGTGEEGSEEDTGVMPRPDLFDLNVPVTERRSTRDLVRPATGTASLCGEWSGALENAEVRRVTFAEHEQGVAVKPADAPLPAGTVEHRRDHVSHSGVRELCGWWTARRDGARSDHVSVCAIGADDDGDGALDRAEVRAERGWCHRVCEVKEEVVAALDPVALDVAADAAHGAVDATAAGCRLRLELASADRVEPHVWTSDRLPWPPVNDDRSVPTAARTETRSYSGSGSPEPGAVVCGWTLVDAADEAHATVRSEHSSERRADLHVDAGRA